MAVAKLRLQAAPSYMGIPACMSAGLWEAPPSRGCGVAHSEIALRRDGKLIQHDPMYGDGDRPVLVAVPWIDQWVRLSNENSVRPDHSTPYASDTLRGRAGAVFIAGPLDPVYTKSMRQFSPASSMHLSGSALSLPWHRHAQSKIIRQYLRKRSAACCRRTYPSSKARPQAPSSSASPPDLHCTMFRHCPDQE